MPRYQLNDDAIKTLNVLVQLFTCVLLTVADSLTCAPQERLEEFPFCEKEPSLTFKSAHSTMCCLAIPEII